MEKTPVERLLEKLRTLGFEFPANVHYNDGMKACEACNRLVSWMKVVRDRDGKLLCLRCWNGVQDIRAGR